MKSQNIVRVEFHNPHLKRLRNNLRIILKLAIIDKIEKFRENKQHYSATQMIRLITNSILKCGAGAECLSYLERVREGFNPRDRPSDLDMVWVPYYQTWLCVKCYDEFFQHFESNDDGENGGVGDSD